jgi:hypothetical protein
MPSIQGASRIMHSTIESEKKLLLQKRLPKEGICPSRECFVFNGRGDLSGRDNHWDSVSVFAYATYQNKSIFARHTNIIHNGFKIPFSYHLHRFLDAACRFNTKQWAVIQNELRKGIACRLIIIDDKDRVHFDVPVGGGTIPIFGSDELVTPLSQLLQTYWRVKFLALSIPFRPVNEGGIASDPITTVLKRKGAGESCPWSLLNQNSDLCNARYKQNL